jgi:hypothetical protein
MKNPPILHKLPHKIYTSMKLAGSLKMAKNYGQKMSEQ